jgi:Uma2 family endonuclease
VSPGGEHGRLQVFLGVVLYEWGHERGHVASEHDINLTVTPDDIRRYLPDIHFTSYETLDTIPGQSPQIQMVAPDLAVEIVSPTQQLGYLAEKVRAFLAAGTHVVLVVDPDRRVIDVHRNADSITLGRGERFTDARFPGLVIDVANLFDSLVRKR